MTTFLDGRQTVNLIIMERKKLYAYRRWLMWLRAQGIIVTQVKLTCFEMHLMAIAGYQWNQRLQGTDIPVFDNIPVRVLTNENSLKHSK